MGREWNWERLFSATQGERIHSCTDVSREDQNSHLQPPALSADQIAAPNWKWRNLEAVNQHVESAAESKLFDLKSKISDA
jgi:hypothetical protein